MLKVPMSRVPLPWKYVMLPLLLRNQWLPPEALRRLQERKLRRLMEHAWRNVPFWRKRFEKAGVRPEEINHVEDLRRLPVIDKSDIRNADPRELTDRRVAGSDSLVEIETSGSSGEPLEFPIDGRYDQFRKAQYLRPYFTNGQRFTDKVLRASVHAEKPARWFHRLGILREERVFSGEAPGKFVSALRRLKPQVLVGYGSFLSLVACRLEEDGGVPDPPPRLIFTDSELLSAGVRERIERVFGVPATDVYGTYETDNIAYECPLHRGYHMAVDAVIMEFLRDGEPVGPGEEGEVVVTVLDNLTTPFIRYNLHDLASFTDEPCPCGRTFPLMTMIGGRLDDCTVSEDGSLRCSMGLVNSFRSVACYVREWQVIQESPKEFFVLLVPASGYCDRVREEIRRKLVEQFPGAGVEFRIVDRIDRSPSGKFRAVISKVAKGRKAGGSGKNGTSAPKAFGSGLSSEG